MLTASLGAKVRIARKEANLTPEQLAVALGVSAATIFRIERDDSDVTVARLHLIAQATGKPIGHFLDNGKRERATA